MKPQTTHTPADDRLQGFQPWHLFLVGSLLASSAAALAVRGTTPANVVFVCLTVLAAGWTAYLLYRACSPLVEGQDVETVEMLGGRTRAALERDKALVLRAIKELEFDRAMGKVSEADYQEMTGRLRARAVSLIKQLDHGRAAYRELIEKDLAARRVDGPRPGAAPGKAKKRAGVAGAAVVAAALGLVGAGAPDAGAQVPGMGGGMPDARAMSGIPMPAESAPAGSVTVRLVRGQLTNPIAGHPVEFVLGQGRAETVKTDASGRATLTGTPPGSLLRAVAVVDGERLETQDFEVRADRGMVVLLAATDKAAPATPSNTGPAVAGAVALSGQSRVVIEFQDDELVVFYLFDILNRGTAPVRTEAPLVFEMPEGATGTTVLEGSSPQAVAQGRRVVVSGPFAPGLTPVQIAAGIPPGGDATIALRLPAPLEGVVVIAQRVGQMVLSSSQVHEIQEMSDSGKRLLMARGPALKAGDTLTLHLAGLPHHATWPRNLALVVALAILGGGVWGATRTRAQAAAAEARGRIDKRRLALLEEVAQLDDRQRREGGDQESYAERREDLLAELERVYGELDSESAPGDQGQSV